MQVLKKNPLRASWTLFLLIVDRKNHKQRMEFCMRDITRTVVSVNVNDEGTVVDIRGLNAARLLAEKFQMHSEVREIIKHQRQYKLERFILKGKWQLALQVLCL